MNKKQMKKRKKNFEVESITMEYFLNSYYNPTNNPLLEKFYHCYFKGCTHEQISIKVEQLNRLLKHHFDEELIDDTLLVPRMFELELNRLSHSIKRIAEQYVKASDVLTGRVVLVSDMTRKKEKLYYVVPFARNKIETLYEREQKMKKSKRLEKGLTNNF